jgi:hypothetical protein
VQNQDERIVVFIQVVFVKATALAALLREVSAELEIFLCCNVRVVFQLLLQSFLIPIVEHFDRLVKLELEMLPYLEAVWTLHLLGVDLSDHIFKMLLDRKQAQFHVYGGNI